MNTKLDELKDQLIIYRDRMNISLGPMEVSQGYWCHRKGFNQARDYIFTPSFLAQLPNELLKEHEGVKKLIKSLNAYIMESGHWEDCFDQDEENELDCECGLFGREAEARAALKEWE